LVLFSIYCAGEYADKKMELVITKYEIIFSNTVNERTMAHAASLLSSIFDPSGPIDPAPFEKRVSVLDEISADFLV